MRNLDTEHADSLDRKYAYDFDYRMHDYMLRSFAPLPKGNALEMGCYHGEFTKKLLPLFDSVTVVEGANDLIAIAQQNVGTGASFVSCLFENFKPDQKFDAIFLIHTLEHLDRPLEILRKVRTWLADGGSFFVAVPNAHAASRLIAVEMGLITHPTAVTAGESEHGHRCTYNQESLNAQLLEAGFSIQRSAGIFFKPFANFQFDRLIASEIVDEAYLEGCFKLGFKYPDLCARKSAVTRIKKCLTEVA